MHINYRRIHWLGVMLLLLARPATAADGPRPLADQYLLSGELAQGELALEDAIALNAKDDQARFGLGVLQLVRGVERLGQSLYEYGAKSEITHTPFVRLPVPRNPDPATIRYEDFRRILSDFHRDLATTDATLAAITDDQVNLPVRLALIRLDLDGDGKPTDRFDELLEKLMRRRPPVLAANPEFLVRFDRGDVAWMRAYCHLLMAMLDGTLAGESQIWFDASADLWFSKPTVSYAGREQDRWKVAAAQDTFKLREPARLKRFRRHLVKVAELNRETWKYVRAETDDDHEWLPNPKQTGVLGLPVRGEMIDAWLDAVAELENVLEGKRLFLSIFLNKNGKGINLKTVLEDPPAQINVRGDFKDMFPDKYWEHGQDVDLGKFVRAASMFQDSLSVGYAVWFN